MVTFMSLFRAKLLGKLLFLLFSTEKANFPIVTMAILALIYTHQSTISSKYYHNEEFASKSSSIYQIKIIFFLIKREPFEKDT